VDVDFLLENAHTLQEIGRLQLLVSAVATSMRVAFRDDQSRKLDDPPQRSERHVVTNRTLSSMWAT
jgi:hypothetical protein